MPRINNYIRANKNTFKRDYLLYRYKHQQRNSVNKWLQYLNVNNGRLFVYENEFAPDRPSLGKIQNYYSGKISMDKELNVLLKQSSLCRTALSQQHSNNYC